MVSFLWVGEAPSGTAAAIAGGLSALFRAACGYSTRCEYCCGIEIRCFCRATTVYLDVAAARQELLAAETRRAAGGDGEAEGD